MPHQHNSNEVTAVTSARCSTMLIALLVACAAPACVVQDSNQLTGGVEARADESTGVVDDVERGGDVTDTSGQKNEPHGALDQLGEDPAAALETDPDAFEGDIILEPDAHPSVAGSRAESKPWPAGRVYYEIDPELPDQDRVKDAIAHWQARTPIRFVKRRPLDGQDAYVAFVVGTGCSSSIGRTGRRQLIRLASGCTAGSTIHEIGHAVGLWHEQSRSDRDLFVKILPKNIKEGHEHNFSKTAFTSAGKYDLGSIMHYGSRYFSTDGVKPTITKLDGTLISGQRTVLSAGDIAGIALLYPKEPK